jgi:hypothetical protein
MIIHYRGHELSAVREESLSGEQRIYYHIYRDSDGYCCVEDHTTVGYVRDKMAELKLEVDCVLDDNESWDVNFPIGHCNGVY